MIITTTSPQHQTSQICHNYLIKLITSYFIISFNTTTGFIPSLQRKATNGLTFTTRTTSSLYEYINENDSNNQNITPPSPSLEHPKQPPPLPSPSPLPKSSKITLVGSGPGDPDLLTIAAHRIITDPTILCIADRLISPQILDLIKGELKVARKLPGCAEKAQNEIYEWVEDGVKSGKHVVRLKIGDPFVFGRGGEEVLKFRELGIEPVIVPGVSAAFSAPLLGGIPVTHRGISNQVVMCTGYGRNNTSPDLIRYHKEQTVVFLMAVGRLRELSANLRRLANYPKRTPVAIVERAGCPGQRTLVGTLESIADLAEGVGIVPPSTIVVGDVVSVLLEKEGEEGVVGLVERVGAGDGGSVVVE